MPKGYTQEYTEGNLADSFTFEAANYLLQLCRQNERTLDSLTGEEEWFVVEIDRLAEKNKYPLDPDAVIARMKKIDTP